MAIAAVLLFLAAPVYMEREAAPRQAAEQFLSAVELARAYSIAHNKRTRLVFADEELKEHAEGKISNAYGVYVFYIPVQPTNTVKLPGEFVGQWIPLSSLPEWQHLPEGVECSVSSNAPGEAELRQLYFNPQQSWDGNEANFFASNYAASVYPLNYRQTPYPTSFPLVETNQPPSSAPDSWPDNYPYRYFKPPFSASMVGQVENSSTGSGRIFFDLRGIEFDPNGRPVFTHTNQMTFSFWSSRNTNSILHVFIDGQTGCAQLENPQSSSP